MFGLELLLPCRSCVALVALAKVTGMENNSNNTGTKWSSLKSKKPITAHTGKANINKCQIRRNMADTSNITSLRNSK